ncbi:uncharacterized protein E0L32_009665 [Thyridium curvatum]|uniref:Major facilitator superfamily (MFS) profile domain-containing protein n=1 Tax=Thyridium curvatum TaxID=1093900 RepID=A0A507ANE6_9PEZI|nr:uncharacterized protein E0L32_009665 [Thyridium curvatum]TPX08847.1 hypothetical protein E0L32_009665 [Thyridium curvatum]
MSHSIEPVPAVGILGEGDPGTSIPLSTVAADTSAARRNAPSGTSTSHEDVVGGDADDRGGSKRAISHGREGHDPPASDPSRREPAEPDVEVPPKKRSRTNIAISMTILCLSVVLSALDLTIVTTAMPAIVASFGSVSGYTWIGGSFVLAQTATTPVWGSLSDIWGRKIIKLVALAAFLVGSLVCAVVKDLESFIAGRAIQGLGAAGMGSMVNIIISDMFSLRDRGAYFAITSVVWAVISAIGPLLGGVFTTLISWRWCFWINLPVGAVVFFMDLFYLDIPNPHTPVKAGLKAVDWTGGSLVIGGTLMALFGLEFGGVSHPWSSPTVVCLLVFGPIVIGIFFFNEWRWASNPIIPLRLFRSASSFAAFGISFCNSYVFFGAAYYLPLYTQAVLGVSALTSGLYLLPLIVSCSLLAAFSGVYIQKTGKYLPVLYFGQLLTTLGVGLFIDLEYGESPAKLFVFQLLLGGGVGMNLEAPLVAAQAALTALDNAAVIATMNFVRSLSIAISIVVGGVVFQNRMNAENPNLTAKIGSEEASKFSGSGAAANVDLIGMLPRDHQSLVRQTYFNGLRTAWIMYVAFAGVATFCNFFVRAHVLSRDHEEAVFGADRNKAVPEPVNVSNTQFDDGGSVAQDARKRHARVAAATSS